MYILAELTTFDHAPGTDQPRVATCRFYEGAFNLSMAELFFLGWSLVSLYLRITLTYRISSPVGFSGSKPHTATGPGIASIFAVIRESNHAYFLTSLHQTRSMRSSTKSSREHAIWRRCKGKGLFPAFIHAKDTACGPLGS